MIAICHNYRQTKIFMLEYENSSVELCKKKEMRYTTFTKQTVY
jgi:hypothetical protein